MDQNQETGFLQDIQQEIDLVPVGPGVRFVNCLIDIIVIYVLEFLFAMIAVVMAVRNGTSVEDVSNFKLGIAEQYLLGFLATLLFYTILEGATKGRTIGKLVTGTVVVREDGSRISFKDALIRSLCRLIPFEPFSAFGYRPWHDKFSNTLVIRKKK